MLQDEYNYYRTKSKQDLLAELVRMTNEQKANGELSAADMERTFSILSPFLDEQQRKTLRMLIDELK